MVKEMTAAAVMRKEVVTKFLEVRTSPNGGLLANAQRYAGTKSAGQRKRLRFI
jgi:hypothetical protein